MDLQIKMGREATLNFFESARAYENGTLVTDELLYSEFQRMAAEEPERFAGLSLNSYRGDFSKGDFRAVEQMQLELKQTIEAAERGEVDKTRDPSVMNEIRSNAEAAYDMTPGGADKRKKKDTAGEYRRFQSQVTEYSRAFMAEKGRPMTGDEQDRLFSMLLTPIIITTPGSWGSDDRNALLMDAPFRGRGDKIRGNIPAEEISLVDEEEARAELRDFYGREPYEDEITRHHNQKVLAANGISPEMSYRELPSEVRTKLHKRYPDASDEELVDLYIEFVLETAKQ
jgi:hypothetical protein